MMTAISLGLALLCALLCALAPWPARRVPTRSLAMALGAGILVAIAGVVLSVAPYPWTNLVVWLIALSGGFLLGRALPLRFWPVLFLLLALSALDILQIALTSQGAPGGSSALPPAALYGNFRLLFPWGHFNVGIGDLLILTMLAESWRRRGGAYLIALAPGVIGFGLAYGFLALTGIGGLPLLPFMTTGWLVSELWYRSARRNSTAVGAGVTRDPEGFTG